VTIIYNPSGQFNLPRSYVFDIRVYVQHTLSHAYMTDNIITVDYSPVPNFLAVIVLAPNFMPWSSNSYSLDYIIQDSYYRINPDPTHIPLDIQVGWASSSQTLRSAINIVLDLGVDIFTFPLAAAPPGYWLPTSLP